MILVGGGSVLVPSNLTFEGVSEVLILEHSNVANAIGAAISQVSGSLDVIWGLEPGDTRAARKGRARAEAERRAIQAGAIPASVRVVEEEEIPLAYIPGDNARLRVKCVGDIDFAQLPANPVLHLASTELTATDLVMGLQSSPESVSALLPASQPTYGEVVFCKDAEGVATTEWVLTSDDVDCIAEGAGILGSGGGGSPTLAALRGRLSVQAGRKMRIVSPRDIADDDVFLGVAFMGAPSIAVEKVLSGQEIGTAVRHLAAHLTKENKHVRGIMICEIGGMNGVEPLVAAADFGLPTGTSRRSILY